MLYSGLSEQVFFTYLVSPASVFVIMKGFDVTAGLSCVGITCILSIQDLFGHVLVSLFLSHAKLQIGFSNLLMASYFLNFVAKKQGSLRMPMQVTDIVDISEGTLTSSHSGYLNASCCCICDQGMLSVSQKCLQVAIVMLGCNKPTIISLKIQ